MIQKGESVTLTSYSSPPKGETTHYILRVASAPSKCVRCAPRGRYHNPRPERPSNLRTLRTLGAQPRQPSAPQACPKAKRPFFPLPCCGTMVWYSIWKLKKPDKYGENWTFKRGRNGIYPTIYPTKHPFIFLQAERRRKYHSMITGGAFLLDGYQGSAADGRPFRKEVVRTVRRKVWACCRNARLSVKVHSFRKEWEPLADLRYYRRTGRKYQGKDTRAGSEGDSWRYF